MGLNGSSVSAPQFDWWVSLTSWLYFSRLMRSEWVFAVFSTVTTTDRVWRVRFPVFVQNGATFRRITELVELCAFELVLDQHLQFRMSR